MATRRLPDVPWPRESPPTTPPSGDGDGLPGPDPYPSVNTPQQPSVIQETLAGAGSIVPIVYGLARLGGQISIATSSASGYLVLCVVWCMGEVNSITVKINDETPPSGVSVTTYLGTTTQGVDPTLAAAIPGYSDNLVYVDPKYGSVGIAYSVVVIPPNLEGVSGFPRITAEIQGRKVWCCVANGYVYSSNPALILADLIRDPILGMRREVDLTSQTALQTVCNELLGGLKRRTVNLALTNAQDIVQWLETLRGYAGCMLYFEGNKAVMVPNRPASPVTAVTADMIVKGSMRVSKRPTAPNVVRVAYTDITAEPWRTNYALVEHPDVTNGIAAWNEESISMPGIHEYGQAYREAIERLNSYRYCDTDIEFTMFDEGLRIVPGDVISVTHPIGFSAVPFRVETSDCSSPGRWKITASKYSASVYSDAAPTAPPFPNIEPPSSEDPEITDPPGGGGGGGGTLTLTEVFSTLSDGTPISKIQASWPAVTHPNFARYEIQWKISTETYWRTDSSIVNSWLSPQVFPVASYQVRVRTMATDLAVGDWLEGTILIDGKTGTGWSPPTAPGGRVGTLFLELTWTFPIDPATGQQAKDIAYTEVYVANSNSFSVATKVALVAYPGNKYVLSGVPASTCRYFWVKFVDTSGNITGTYPTSPNGGVQLCTPAPSSTANQDLLNYLSGQIIDSHLHTSLSTYIDEAYANANSATVQVGQLEEELYGEYYVKVQTNTPSGPAVAGFGLSNQTLENGTAFSQFLVVADRFAVVSTGPSPVVPFVVDALNNRVVMGNVYIGTANIDNASITSAKIGDLQVGTGKITDNAVSKASSASFSDITFSSAAGSTTTYTNIVSVSGANVYAILIAANFKAYVGELPNGVLQGDTCSAIGTATKGSLSVTLSYSGKYNGSMTYDQVTSPGGLPVTIARPYGVTATSDATNINLSISFTGYPSRCVINGGTDFGYENTTVTTGRIGIFVWQK